MTLYLHLPNNRVCNLARLAADFALGKTNITFAHGGTRFKLHSLTQIELAYSMFRRNLGHRLDFIQEEEVRGLCDLGCNAGFFTLWVARQWPKVCALLVDANPHIIKTACWNTVLNKIEASVIHGLVGGSGTFHIAASDQLSTTYVLPWMATEFKETILVPRVDPENLYSMSVASQFRDLLKIDIEGSELNLLEEHPDFVRSFKRVIVEWHSPRATEAAVRYHMQALGFSGLHSTGNDTLGILYFRRSR